MTFCRLFLALFIAILMLPQLGFTADVVDDVEAIQSPLPQIFKSKKVDGVTLGNVSALSGVYKDNEDQPLWLKSSYRTKKQLKEFVEVLNESWAHGLNPNKYNTIHLSDIVDQDGALKGEDLLKADVVLTDALIKYGQDLTGTRINPRDLGLYSKSINKPISANQIIKFITEAYNPIAGLKGLEPKGKLYNEMSDQLAELYLAPQQALKPINIKRSIEPRTHHSAIPLIRTHLRERQINRAEGPEFYDDDLAQVVMAFQKKHGLKPDGIIGQQTLRILNMSPADKIKKLIVNMERLRWEEVERPNRYIMVNVPAETLWGVSHGKTAFQMPVIVGRPKRATNTFSTMITGVRINPTWTIPPTIKREDYVAKLRDNPNYLVERGVDLYREGEQLDSTMVDWTRIGDGELGGFRMVQGSGSSNPLGRFRVLMNNPFNIYLHDTPAKANFSRSNRALSSGCIRMSDPEKVTDFILGSNKNWSEDRKQALLKAGKMRDVIAAEPLPVYLLYHTIWLGDDGNLIYGNDMYNRDSALFNLLKKNGDIPNI